MDEPARVRALIEEARQHAESLPDEARETLVSAMELARRIDLESEFARAAEVLGLIALRTHCDELAEKTYAQAARTYAAQGDLIGAARSEGALGFLAGPREFRDDREALEEEVLLVRALVEHYKGRAPGRAPALIAQRTKLELRRRRPTRSGPLPALTQLAQAFDLDGAALGLLAVAAAPALDERLARLLRDAQGDLMARAPGAWFVAALCAPSLSAAAGEAELLAALAEEGPLRCHDLLYLSAHPDRPRGARRHALVEIDPDIASFLEGRRGLSGPLAEYAALVEPPADYIGPPEELSVRWDSICHALQGEQAIQRVVITGAPGAGKKALAAQLARALGRRLLVLNLVDLGHEGPALLQTLRLAARDARLHEAVLALDLRDGFPEAQAGHLPALYRQLNAALAERARPMFLVARSMDAAAKLLGPSAIEIRMPPLALDDQVLHYQRAMERLGAMMPDADLLRAVGCQAGLTAGAIEEAAARAVAKARLEDAQKPHPSADDIREAVRVQFGSMLAGIAQRIVSPFRFSDLVLPEHVLGRLQDVVNYVRHLSQVFDVWGFQSKVPYGRGVSALFAGPPGTGKTMAAGVIAAELGLDLYRIDLSQIVSKWIGETEKNLSRVFDRAADGQAVLLFDEADSLFAKRTEVKTSVDRYSNLEVNYLLQRLETFDGITILTTNFLKNIDEAFRRRLRFIIEFPSPTEEEREALWRSMIPPSAQVRGKVPFDRLASFDMSGGHIKNAVMRAAFAAASRHDEILPYDLLRAAVVELEGMGRLTSDIEDLYDSLELPPEEEDFTAR